MKKSNPKGELQFENERVCIWKTTIPHHPPLMLGNVPRIVVGLNHGQLQLLNGQGAAHTLHIEPHRAYWIGDHHSCCCAHPMEVMMIEMKGPPTRPLPSMPID